MRQAGLDAGSEGRKGVPHVTVVPDDFAELDELAGAQCEDRLTPEQLARLEQLVLGGAAQRLQYIWYMHTHAHAEQANQEQKDDGPKIAEQLGCAIEAVAAEKTHDGCGVIGGGNESPFAEPVDAPRPTGSLGSPIPPIDVMERFAAFRLPVLQPFLGGVVLSYGLAMLLLGAATFAAWTWRLPEAAPQVARNMVLAPAAAPVGVAPPNVARIIRSVGCGWARADVMRDGADVSLGSTFYFTTGRLEIRYNIGAKVVIQGPALFVVDAPNGGCLRFGNVFVQLEPGARRPRGAVGEVPQGGPRGLVCRRSPGFTGRSDR